MGAVQEIAYYLSADASQVYSALAYQAGNHPELKRILSSLENLDEKAQIFYEGVVKNTKSPWRTVSGYEDLDRAFVAASAAFMERPAYLLDPRGFEEIAYLMGALLQFYQYPIESYTVYPANPTFAPNYAYPRVVYPWIPAFYTFSTCRFTNWRTYPWARHVIIK